MDGIVRGEEARDRWIDDDVVRQAETEESSHDCPLRHKQHISHKETNKLEIGGARGVVIRNRSLQCDNSCYNGYITRTIVYIIA